MGVPVSIAKPGFDREEDDQSDDDSSVKARKRRSRGKKHLEEQKPRTEEDIKVVVKQEAANEPVPAIKRASRPRPKASVRSSSLRVKLVLNRDMIFARREFRCLDNDSSASCNVLIDFNPRLLKAKIDCNSVPSKLYPYTYKGSSGIPALLARRPPTFDEGNLCTDGARQLAVAHTELARSRWLDFYLLAFLDAIMDREIVTPGMC
ncbi:hypothetical protein K474DRAFT_479435 [Panus rudis PR-1116 ss-1]|nr:hypothetical protein K474DRAFT_479435 [Panus rudis PR-1116 ss-1]